MVRGSRDVEKDDLVRPLAVIEGSQLRGVAGVAQVLEANALDDAGLCVWRAWLDQPQSATKFSYTRSPSGPLFSGWNCVPITLRRAAAAAGECSVDAIVWRDESGV